jgi:hypothetical protein
MKTLTALLVLAALTVSVHAQEQFLSQPKIVVLPKSVNGVDALTLMKSNDTVITAAAAIRKVLVDRKLEVGDLEQLASNADFNRSMMAGLNSDMNAVIASAADADVYFEFTYEVIQGRGIKAKVNFNVKEASTGKVLGSGIGNSDYTITSDFGSLCAIAINNEINSIMEQIRSYWVDIPKYGKPIMLTIAFKNTEVNAELPTGQYIDEVVEDWIAANSKSYRPSSKTDKTIIYNPIHVDHVKYDKPTRFSRELRKLFDKTLGIKVDDQVTGKSIRIEGD